MSDERHQGSLELEVSNFGPIVEAKLDLRPLTVFIGPSNTGKSYLAILLYALHGYFADRRRTGGRISRPNPLFFHRSKDSLLPKEIIESAIELSKNFLERKGKKSSRYGIILPRLILDFIHSPIERQGDFLANEIGRCFGMAELGSLVRKGSKDTGKISFRRCGEIDGGPIDHKLVISPYGNKFTTNIPKDVELRVGVGRSSFFSSAFFENVSMEIDFFVSNNDEEGLNSCVLNFLDNLIDPVMTQIVDPFDLPAYYLPADRTGVMHAHNVVVSALIESAAMTGLRPAARTPMLSGVLADFLEQLIELDQPSIRRRGSKRDFGAQIERSVLSGGIGVEKLVGTGYPRFTYQPKGWKDSLSLMNASSMVSELAPVVLFLRHVIEPGNVLIVEEPESHLHPAMQVEFTRQIAALVRAGIRVIITTHSEWVLEELGNIVRRSEIPAAEQGKAGVEEPVLGSDEVGVWLFEARNRPKGSVVKEVRLEDTGLFSSGFDEVAAALHNEWADISSKIGETE